MEIQKYYFEKFMQKNKEKKLNTNININKRIIS